MICVIQPHPHVLALLGLVYLSPQIAHHPSYYYIPHYHDSVIALCTIIVTIW